MKNALVTGGSGFVGRYMIEALENRGFQVKNIDLEEGVDCRDFFSYDHQRFDLVVHLAAIVGGRLTIENEPLSVATDLAIDSDMFRWAVETKQPHVIYYSSSAAYPIAYQTGAPGYVPLPEHDIDLNEVMNPDMTYGWAKLTGEYLASFARREGVRVDVFRPFSGYGTDQSIDYPFPAFIRRALQRADPFEVWGDGLQVRDWIHMSDVVEATLTWAENSSESVTVNLCSGVGTSFLQLARGVTRAAGYEPIITPLADFPTGVRYRVGNPTLMNTLYTPKVTLEEGIDRALKGIR